MKLVMTLLVRNEADILATNIEYHLRRGVDFFIATDNLSEDGTRDILEHYRQRNLLHLILETNDNYSQSTWVTRMARMAAVDFHADWVINSDADEFWWPEEVNDLGDLLARIPPDVHAVHVERHDFVPRPNADNQIFTEVMTVREQQSTNARKVRLLPKMCHRGYSDIEVAMGNHRAARAGGPMHIGRAPLSILHFPLRSYEQFRRKIVTGGAALERNKEHGPEIVRTWRSLYRKWQQGELEAYYRQREVSAGELDAGLASQTLVRDERLRDFMRFSRVAE